MEKVPTRKPPRAMLALIALATDLPVPEKISMYQADDGEHRLVLDLKTMADGRAWAEQADAGQHEHENGGMRYLSAMGNWNGWTTYVYASETEPPGGELTDQQAADLTELAEARP